MNEVHRAMPESRVELLLRPGVLQEAMFVQSVVLRYIQPFPVFRLHSDVGREAHVRQRGRPVISRR